MWLMNFLGNFFESLPMTSHRFRVHFRFCIDDFLKYAPTYSSESLKSMWREILSEKLIITQLASIFPPFIEEEFSSHYLQKPAIDTYFEPGEFNLHSRVPISLKTAITHKLNISVHMLIWTFLLVFLCGTWAHNLYTTFRYILYKKNRALTRKQPGTQRCGSSYTEGTCERNTLLFFLACTCPCLMNAAHTVIIV
jgi:hypothetical protein